MAMLSPEINRFLGHALLDPTLVKRIFSADRASALLDYNLLPEVSAMIMTSKACSLPELARELLATFAGSPSAEMETDTEKFYQSVHNKPVSVRQVQAIAKKVINRASAGLEEEYAQLRSA